MGVRGLQGFVGSTCPHICTVVNIQELAENHRTKYPGCTPTIVVDAMCCLRYWYTPESWICGGQWREYFSALRDFVAAFTSAGIKLIFFFDGMVEPGKRDEWVKRRLKNNREISKIFHYIKSKREQPGRNMFFIPSGLAIFTRFALKSLGQETFCSLQEADYEVASYGLQHNCLGILGEDTDYLIYDTCPYFSIGDLCLETLETIMLCREKLCESLGLHVADLPLLACLLGNDITPEGMFESFRYKCLSSYASVKENAGKKGNIILAVSDYISRVLRLYQGEKKIEEMLPLGSNKALFYKGVAAYLLPGQTSPWLVQKSKGIITEKQVVNPESKQEVPMCLDPESKQEVPARTNPESMQEVPMCTDPESNQEASMCTDPESKQEASMCTDPESNQEASMCTDPESKQEVSIYTYPEVKQKLPSETGAEYNSEVLVCTPPEVKQEDAMDMEPEIKQVTMDSDSEILKVARMHHVHSESYLVYNIMSTGEIECSNTLEDELDQALPSQAFIYRPIRQRVYALLLGDWKDGARSGPVVKEWFVYPGNSLKHPDLVRPLQVTIQDQTVLELTEIHLLLPSDKRDKRLIRVFNSWSWDSGAVDTLGGAYICLEQWVTKSGPYLLQIIACVYNSWVAVPRDSVLLVTCVIKLEEVTGSTGRKPSLEVLWLSQEPAVQARRLDTLLACFNLSSSREDLQAVESPLRALCCLLIYIFVQVDTLSLEDLHAFIAQALCLQGKSTSQLMNVQPDYINSRAVQLGSLLVRGLTMLVLVNSACGFPWTTSEFMPWNVFDGKLFHQKYLQSEKGYAVEVLLEQNRSWLTKFHNLKAVVCKACSKENRRIVGRTHWNSHYTGRLGRQGSSSHRTGSTHGHPGHGQPWRDQGPGGRQYEHDQWRRY